VTGAVPRPGVNAPGGGRGVVCAAVAGPGPATAVPAVPVPATVLPQAASPIMRPAAMPPSVARVAASRGLPSVIIATPSAPRNLQPVPRGFRPPRLAPGPAGPAPAAWAGPPALAAGGAGPPAPPPPPPARRAAPPRVAARLPPAAARAGPRGPGPGRLGRPRGLCGGASGQPCRCPPRVLARAASAVPRLPAPTWTGSGAVWFPSGRCDPARASSRSAAGRWLGRSL